MGFVSPQQVIDDPKQFLKIPHEMHKVLGKLLERLSPGFKQKLVDQKIHCVECDGIAPIFVLDEKHQRVVKLIGYVGDVDRPELYMTEKLSVEEEIALSIALLLAKLEDSKPKSIWNTPSMN